MFSLSGLTHDQHRTVRTHLALIPAYVWIGDMWWLFIRQLPVASDPTHAHLVRDFLHFYVQGVIARDHAAHALYDINEMAAVAERVLPGIPKHIFPPVYGPQVSLLFLPFASLSYLHALYAWLAITCAGTLICLSVIWQQLRSRLPRSAWVLGVLVMGTPGFFFTLSFAQASVIGMAAFTGAWAAFRSDHPFIAGLAIGLLAYKPPLGVVSAIVFLWRREWWVVLGALASLLTQLIGAIAYWGISILRDYAAALQNLPKVLGAMEPDVHLAYSIRAVLGQFGLSPSAAVAASVLVSAAVVAWMVINWKPSVPIDRRYSGLVLASLAINPHLYGYDLLLAAPGMLIAGAAAWSEWDTPLLLSLGCLYVTPIVSAAEVGPPWMTTVALLVGTILTPGHLHKSSSQVIHTSDDL